MLNSLFFTAHRPSHRSTPELLGVPVLGQPASLPAGHHGLLLLVRLLQEEEADKEASPQNHQEAKKWLNE